MIAYDAVKDFWEYILYYPDEDEEGFDGVHYGGIKGISDDAPESAKAAYQKWVKVQTEAKKLGIKL